MSDSPNERSGLELVPSVDRLGFVRTLRELMATEDTVGLLVVDIQDFKRINHTFGLTIADQLLVKTFATLSSITLKGASVFRLGGNEFAIVLPSLLDPSLLVLAANKVCKVFEQPLAIGEHFMQISVRIGYASNAIYCGDVEELLRHAEIFLEDAKSQGVPYVEYDDANELQAYDWQLESELNQAIINNELILFFQPKISFREEGKIHLEALARWMHPKRGMISPLLFIPLAEQTGGIKLLTKWAIHSALRSLTEWPGFLPLQDKGHTTCYSVAVNLSVQALEGEGFVELVAAALNIWGVAPENLTLEVTEGVFVNDTSRAVRCLHELKALGVCISIDDFGTGYSCLSYFKNIPAGELKIDKSFVEHLTENGDDQYLAQLIIDLGHRFNMTVVAEGIEDLATFTLLQKMGCDYAQGFYRAKPMPQDVLLAWLEKYKEGRV